MTVDLGDDSTVLLAIIQECIAAGRFQFTAHALTKHAPLEGFTPRQALEALLNGTIIERYDDRSRCLISGTAAGLALSQTYIATYIHCVCSYDDIRKIVIITMYRPHGDEWINGHRRRTP